MLRPSTGFRNSQATNLATDFDSAFLDLYSGSQPSSPDDAPTGILLVTLTLPSSAFSVNIDVLNRNSTWEGAAVADGDIGWGRFRLSGDGGGSSSTDKRFDVDVGTALSNIIRLSTVSIKTGQTIRIGNVTIKIPVVPSGFGGAANLIIPMMTLAASGGVTISGIANLTIPMMELGASGNLPIESGANLVIPMMELEASGVVDVIGEAALTIPMMTLLASSVVTFTGEASLTIPMMELSASGGVEVKGAASLTIPMMTLNATSTTPRIGVANLTIPMMNVVARAFTPTQNEGWPELELFPHLRTVVEDDWMAEGFWQDLGGTDTRWSGNGFTRKTTDLDVVDLNPLGVPNPPTGGNRALRIVTPALVTEGGFGPWGYHNGETSPSMWIPANLKNEVLLGWWAYIDPNFYGHSSGSNKHATINGFANNGVRMSVHAMPWGAGVRETFDLRNDISAGLVEGSNCNHSTHTTFNVFVPGEWARFVMYYKKANASGNFAILKVWKNGQLIVDRNNICDFAFSSTSKLDGIGFHGVWGGRFEFLPTDNIQFFGPFVIAVGEDEPPASVSFPNMPSPNIAGVDVDFSSKIFPNQPGGTWGYNSGWLDDSRVYAANDPQEIGSPPSTVELFWPSGQSGGDSPGRAVCKGPPSAFNLYIGMISRWSPGWTTHTSGIDKLFYWGEESAISGGGQLAQYMLDRNGSVAEIVLQYGQGYDPLRNFSTQRRIPDQHDPPRLASTNLAQDKYFTFEIKCYGSTDGQANGRIQVWVDNILQFDVNDIRWQPSGNTQFKLGINLDPVWGGIGNNKPKDEWLRYGHLRIVGF